MTLRALVLLLLCLVGQAANRPTVLLISLDGFRFDYAAKYGAKNLMAFGKRGVHAKAMLPSFPSTTFPNHYTIATGLYPAHHGIVDNSFYDPAMKASFRFSDPKVASDPRFWGGTPLWVLAEKQGVIAASYFWPGSDYEIGGKRPTYWHAFDSKTSKETQIAEVEAWLKLPETKRPHFMTLYFSDVDHAGHDHGPESEETREAVLNVDRALGDLFARVKRSRVPVDVFVVSDHGMAAVEPMIDLSKVADFDGLTTSGSGTNLEIYSDDAGRVESLYKALAAAAAGRYRVYKKADIPEELHYSGNARIGDLVVFARERLTLGLKPPKEAKPGTHGFNVKEIPEMRAIFYAAGPDLKRGLEIGEFENIHVYPLIAKLLRLSVRDTIDGDVNVLAPILR